MATQTFEFTHQSNGFITRIVLTDGAIGQVNYVIRFVRPSTAWTSWNVNPAGNASAPRLANFNILGTALTTPLYYTYDWRTGTALTTLITSGTVNVTPGVSASMSGTNNPQGSMGTASISGSFTPAGAPPFFPFFPPFFPPYFPFFPPYFPFFPPYFPFFPSFTPAPVWSEGSKNSQAGKELQALSIPRVASNATSYSIVLGTLPSGLSISSSTGTISGTPARNTRGTYEIEVMATGPGGSSGAVFLLIISGPDGVIQIYDTATSQWKEGVVHIYNSGTSTWVESLTYIYDSATSSWVISKNKN